MGLSGLKICLTLLKITLLKITLIPMILGILSKTAFKILNNWGWFTMICLFFLKKKWREGISKLVCNLNFYIRSKILYISLVFITQSYFIVPKHVKLNSTYYFITTFYYILLYFKTLNKFELQQIAIDHPSDVE